MTAVPARSPRDALFEPISRLTSPGTVSATLLSRDGRDAMIGHDGVTRHARIAFGCLIQPEPGDEVLTAAEGSTIWIMAVLERTSGAPARLWSAGTIDIVADGGDVSVSAKGQVSINAGASARVAAPEVEIHAGIGRFVIDELVQIGREARLLVDRIRGLGQAFEVFADHFLVRAKRATRQIEESDQLRAGTIDHRADGSLHLHAETAFVTADTVVRVDADQIHMG